MMSAMMKLCVALSIITLVVGYQRDALALECPKAPEQSIKDLEVEVNAAVARIGPVSGGELKTKTKNATQDILGKLPNADKVYLEHMFFAAYCSALRDDKTLSESQKAQRLNEHIGEVRKTIRDQVPEQPTVTPPLKQPGKKTSPLQKVAPQTSPINPGLQSDFQAYQIERRNVGNTINFFKMNGPLRYRAWLDEAEQGNPMAQVLVGRALQTGLGILENKEEAVKWFQRAADQGNSAGQFNLAHAYNLGLGIPKNTVTAGLFYSAAQKQNHSGAMHALGNFYRGGVAERPKDAKIAAEWYQRAIELGESNAMIEAASLYAAGADGIPVDKAKARFLYEQAAKLGNERAKSAIAAQTIAATFATYTADNVTPSDRTNSLGRAQAAVGELGSISAEGLIGALGDYQVQIAAERLMEMSPTDPMRAVNSTMIDRLINTFRTSELATRTIFLEDFSNIVAGAIQNLEERQEHQRIAYICNDTYAGIKLSTLLKGERNRTVDLLATCVTALYATGYRAESTILTDEALSMIEKILSERPWDWFLKGAARRLCWSAGASLVELGDHNKSQEYLQQAWHSAFKMLGREDLIGKFPTLPVKGAVPANATVEDKVFFQGFSEGSWASGHPRRFMIPTDFDGTKLPHYYYVVSGKRGYRELQDQFVSVKEYRGGQIPSEVAKSFHRLNKIAIDNNVDFLELVVYAMKEEPKKENTTQ
jgi:TPR repeat protein